MAQIAELNSSLLTEDEEDANYLYKKDEYTKAEATPNEAEKTTITDEDGFEIPDHLTDEDDIIKID